MPKVRQANPTDASGLCQLAERTFRDTFGAVNTAEDMALHCGACYTVEVQASEISNPNMLTLLSEDRDALAGFAQLRWEGAPDCVSARAPAEIKRLYVLARWHGKGVARELMQACLEAAEARGSDVVWLGVWEHNPRAIAFYRKFGFSEVGEQIFLLGSDRQRDIVMVRPVAVPKASERT